jgi:hypothetical protein
MNCLHNFYIWPKISSSEPKLVDETISEAATKTKSQTGHAVSKAAGQTEIGPEKSEDVEERLQLISVLLISVFKGLLILSTKFLTA